MITVDSNFKSLNKEDTKLIKAYITDGVNEITGADDLKSIKYYANGGICRTVMRQVDFNYWGEEDYADAEVNVGWGVAYPETDDLGTVTLSIATPCVVTLASHGLKTGDKVKLTTTGELPTGLSVGNYFVINKYDEIEEEQVLNINEFYLATTYANAIAGTKIATSGSQSGTHNLEKFTGGFSDNWEEIDYGTFKVVEVEVDKANELKKVKAFDKMYEALQIYTLEDLEYPMTLIEFLGEICTELGWVLGTAEFLNDDLEVSAEMFTREQITYREVLDMIAEASGTIMLFNNGDELELRAINTTPVETIVPNDMMTLKFESKWGGLNSLVLARTPQEDNIVQKDDEDIALNGLWEFKIENNEFLDDDRETLIGDIYTALDGIEYYNFESRTLGLGYFDIGDFVTVTDLSSVSRVVMITSVELEIGSGVRETIKSESPDKATTNYDYAGVIGQEIKRTEIIVDKQKGEILSLVDDTTQMKQTAESIQLLAQSAKDQSDVNTGDIDTLSSDVSELELRADGLDIAVTQAGGSNLLKNSSGLKGSLEEWGEEVEYGSEVIENWVDYADRWIYYYSGLTLTEVVDGLNVVCGEGDYGSVQLNSKDRFGFYEGGTSWNIEGTFSSSTEVYMEVYSGYSYSDNYCSIDIVTSGINTSNPEIGVYMSGDYIFVDDFTEATDKYFRTRHSGGITFFEKSADGESWTGLTQTDRLSVNEGIWIGIYMGESAGEEMDLTVAPLLFWGDNTQYVGTIDQSTEVAMNTESGSAIRVEDNYITQTVDVILDQLYTFYCRFKKYGDVTVDLTGAGLEEPLDLTVDDYVDEEWAVFKYQFTALSEKVTLKIDATTEDAWAVVGDMVIKIGEVTGWVQAPNEVYGKNFRFDKDGFSITSQTDAFKSVLDNTKLAVYDTSSGGNRVVMVVSKDSGKISSLVAQETLSIQRYENPASRVRFIPTSTGCMVVVND